MMTVRQIERMWMGRQYQRLFAELWAARPEGGIGLGLESGPTMTAAAALAVIRLDEWCQSQVPLAGQLIRTILSLQEADGSWSDPAITSLCLRALLCGNGQGLAIDRGMQYLAHMQKSEGIWPREPLRRMPADPLISALVLYELGQNDSFRQRVRWEAALAWFEKNETSLDTQTRRMWERAKCRCLTPHFSRPGGGGTWSPAYAA
jgi:hypothetical protein